MELLPLQFRNGMPHETAQTHQSLSSSIADKKLHPVQEPLTDVLKKLGKQAGGWTKNKNEREHKVKQAYLDLHTYMNNTYMAMHTR